ncbi:TIGR03621 family F420-dependent LLM class oxidoreductase [Ilumatobacter coccineus]|uniref:Putative oxidoreductase n=1 Tax=Ilumatobacter coccineus (strain NBRC 103263 / KCTC 29153 / YM16-304) TaxID=1313172 RepID=A0A6C7EC42_ILUCY|nr:TIGR03621 family F420-dependent LLM class oxidoreductase [Ilumatobacter coccineus]BAN02208.1 putative oxidoreductase [Ilumatobacter coccineus YM16-304]
MSDAHSPFPIKPFRFGVQLRNAPDGVAWTEQAKRIESHGYSTATMPDHFDDQFAPMPALQAMLSATTTLRVGALVFDNDYKHPLVLAKELATMDVLSNGRVEIGLGAGWMIADYEQAGMQYDRAGVRIDRFVEGLAVIKGLMGQEPFSFDGDHYTIREHNGFPKPVQAPHPPIIIGGGGPRVLDIAAREADIVGVNGTLHAGVIGPEAIATMTRDAVIEKVGIVADAARAAGRLDHIEMNVRTFFVSVTDDRDAQTAAMAEMIGVDEQMVRESPFALIGSPEQIADDLVARREEFGFSYVIVGANEIDDFAPVVARLAGT